MLTSNRCIHLPGIAHHCTQYFVIFGPRQIYSLKIMEHILKQLLTERDNLLRKLEAINDSIRSLSPLYGGEGQPVKMKTVGIPPKADKAVESEEAKAAKGKRRDSRESSRMPSFQERGNRSWPEFIVNIVSQAGDGIGAGELTNLVHAQFPEKDKKGINSIVRTNLSKLKKEGTITGDPKSDENSVFLYKMP